MKNKASTRLTKVTGMIAEARGRSMSVSHAIITARFTADEIGETLSLQAGDLQITVPFEPIKKLIKEARESK